MSYAQKEVFFIAKFSIVKKENSKFDFTFSKILAEWLIKMAKIKHGYSLGQPTLLLSFLGTLALWRME